MIIDAIDFSQPSEISESSSSQDKICALSDVICKAGDEAAAALFVLMGTLETRPIPN
jgi:hypothetical protein